MRLKLIPGTDGFLASDNGRIFNSSGDERNYYRNADGYKTASVKIGDDWITFGVHRLVAMAFLEHEKTPERQHVNHIDGDLDNNGVDNLDYVSVKENNIHAAILRGNPTKPILIAISPAREPMFINSNATALALIKCSLKELWFAVKYDRLINGWSVRYNSGPLPASLRKSVDPSRYEKVSIEVLDVDTKEVEEFPSMREFAVKLGTTTSLISQTITTSEKIRLCFGKYVIVRKGETFPFITDELIQQLRQRRNRSVIVGHIDSKRIEIFRSAVDFYRKYDLSKKRVTVSLKRDVIRPTKGMIFLYMRDKNSERIKQFLKPSGAIR